MDESVLFALLAALCYGISPLFEKIGLRQAQPMAAVFIRALITCLYTGIYLALGGNWQPLSQWSPRTWSAIMVSGVAGVLLAQYFYFMALRHGQAARVVPIAGSYPLFACILAALFLGEKLSPGRILGISLIVAGIIFLS